MFVSTSTASSVRAQLFSKILVLRHLAALCSRSVFLSPAATTTTSLSPTSSATAVVLVSNSNHALLVEQEAERKCEEYDYDRRQDHDHHQLGTSRKKRNLVVEENCRKEGVRDSRHWDVNAAGDPHIQGFAKPFSIAAGGVVEFRVKTVSQKYRIDIYRLGFYFGKGARLVHSIGADEIFRGGGERNSRGGGQPQPECRKDPKTRLVDCSNWHAVARWNSTNTKTAVISGVYIARFVREDAATMPWTTTWRSDASFRGANDLYGHSLDLSTQSEGEEDDTVFFDTALGLQRRRDEPDKPLLENALHEPYASLAFFVVRRHERAQSESGADSASTGDKGRVVDGDIEKYDIALQTSDSTWMAYNVWDSPNTYGRTPLFNCPHFNFTNWWKSTETGAGQFDEDDKTPVNKSLANENFSAANAKRPTTRSKTAAPPPPTAHDFRALRKSYNTPLITREVSLYNTIFSSEYPMIRFLEAQGFAVSYVSSVDVHLGGRGIGRDVQVFLSVGHDEYWSREQRRTVERLLGKDGVSLGFFSGNEMYWTHGWTTSGAELEQGLAEEDGRKQEDPDVLIIEKESQMAPADFQNKMRKLAAATQHHQDQIEAYDSATTRSGARGAPSSPGGEPERERARQVEVAPRPPSATWTGTFRDPRQPGGASPENALIGVATSANALRNDPISIPARFAGHRFWRNTDIASLLKQEVEDEAEKTATIPIKGILGHEWDSDLDNGFRPEGLMHVSETKLHNVHALLDFGATLDSATLTHAMTLYRDRTRGGLVFAAGTCQLSWGLDPVHDRVTGTRGWENEQSQRIGYDLAAGPTGERNLQQAVLNLFADMGNVQPGTLLEESYGLARATGADSGRRGGSEALLKTVGKLVEDRGTRSGTSSNLLRIEFAPRTAGTGVFLAAVEVRFIFAGGSSVTDEEVNNDESQVENSALPFPPLRRAYHERWRAAQFVAHGKFLFRFDYAKMNARLLPYIRRIEYRGIDDHGNIEKPANELELTNYAVRQLLNRRLNRATEVDGIGATPGGGRSADFSEL